MAEGNEVMGEVRQASTAEPFYVFAGGRVSGDVQEQRHYEVRVAATMNGVDSDFTNWVNINTGYPFHIRKRDYFQRGNHYIAAKNVLMGLTIPPVAKPYWCQNSNPFADLYVGVVIDRLRFENLRATGINSKNQVIAHKRLMFADNPAVDDIRYMINGALMTTIPSNPTTEPPFYGSMAIEQWGAGPIGIMPTGAWWGIAAPNTQPTRDSWISGTIIAEGSIYEYLDPEYPSMSGGDI